MSNDKTILINSPYIVEKEKYYILASQLVIPNENDNFVLWYAVKRDYGKYLCEDRGDPFVLGVLEYAMHLGYDIISEAPLTEKLLFQLNEYYIPIVSKNMNCFNKIKIKALTSNDNINSEGKIGAALSGGVDSYYTISKYTDATVESKITHLLCANVGAFRYEGGEISRNIFYDTLNFIYPVAQNLNLELVAVDTNYMEFYKAYYEPVNNCGALKTLSCVYALRKLFKAYYFSSGYEAEKFHFTMDDVCAYDLFTLKEISVDNLTFYLSGAEASRMDKIKYIADKDYVQEYLSVCVNRENCGKCKKCIRTQLELYSINKLNSFSKVFDLSFFYKNKRKLMAKNFADGHENSCGFNREIIKELKLRHQRIPFTVYVLSWLYYRPIGFVKSKFRFNTRIRKIYYKFNIDILLHGEKAKEFREYYITKNDFKKTNK